MSHALSVVIPTHNRRDILRLCLDALRRQTTTTGWELILVDDGSQDDSAAMAREEAQTFAVPMKVIAQQPNSGPAAARNRGLEAASGDLVLFLDDDILAAPDLIERHLQAHRQHPETTAAVLGYITWSPSLRPTPFMYWLGEKVWFCYGHVRPGAELDGWAFYTCNVSLKRLFLNQVGGFDERFPGGAYAFEDSELGWRLQKAGMKLIYHPEAWGHHQQYVTFAAACRREQRVIAARPVYESTEAGQADVARRSLRPPKSRWRQRANRIAVRLLLPFRPLLDTQVPLPSACYREILKHAVREQETAQE